MSHKRALQRKESLLKPELGVGCSLKAPFYVIFSLVVLSTHEKLCGSGLNCGEHQGVPAASTEPLNILLCGPLNIPNAIIGFVLIL